MPAPGWQSAGDMAAGGGDGACGDYQLRVVVSDQVGGTRTDRTVAFSVES